MTRRELYEIRQKYFEKIPYKMMHHSEFKFSLLNKIMYERKAGRGDNSRYNDVIIMADTETSKSCKNEIVFNNGKKQYKPVDNYVVAWTISIRAYDRNIVTLYGHKPTTLAETIVKIHRIMEGEKTFFFWHNLAYDWVFIRQFMFELCGYPEKQLNTKPHYPINIEFNNGIIFRDSLILAQRSLQKWANDLDAEHKKAVGKWDYDKIRKYEDFTQDELEYIECDTLAGVECINITKNNLKKHIYNIPLTATGIPREECRTRGKAYNAHENFLRQALTLEQYLKMLKVYHGGFVHADRHLTDTTIDRKFLGDFNILCYDFSSSYPFNLISMLFPCEVFVHYHDCKLDEIIRNSDKYAFMFKLIMIKPHLKDDNIVMPSLQYSKATKTINAVQDNGRILCAEYVEIYLNEVDALTISEQYDGIFYCVEVEVAKKDYLPRWFTDYVYELYVEKCNLKPYTNEEGVVVYDSVAMSMCKSKINSCYGMCAQRSIMPLISENYDTGEYTQEEQTDITESYEKYLKNRKSIFNYQIGVWVTSYAMRNLFLLGSCCNNWIYSDTDSCFGWDWDNEKLEAYNNRCKELLLANGYGGVMVRGKEYWLGVAELDKTIKSFRMQGAKRYAYIDENDKLKITVAGVPKVGASCLSSLDDFKKGFVFDGLTTGKKTHSYIYKEKHIENGVWIADSIDLNPCDYLLDDIEHLDWEEIFTKEIEIQVYE